jgi:protein TonB
VSAAAIALQFDTSTTAHPVPRAAALDDGRQLLSRGALVSLALHLALAIVAVAINYWPQSAVVGTPVEEVMDVTIIPLSALDTVLPQGAPVPPQPAVSEPAAPPPVPAKLEPLKPKSEKPAELAKKIVASKTIAPKNNALTDTDDQRLSETAAALTSANRSQQFGVANGEAASLEHARISYQDMIATLLARAKRYPERALKRRVTGEGAIRLEISADGSLASFQILRSTETVLLDEELRAMVERAAPFPAFPSDLRKNRLALVVPIAFRLES